MEVGVERAAAAGTDSHRIRHRLGAASSYQEGVEWSALSEEARSRMNRTMATRQVAAAHYRDATQTEAVPLRVRMPTGHVFTQVDESAFRNIRTGMGFGDEKTGLIWSQAMEDNMNWEQATAACANIGGRLPSISELETWVSHLGRSDNQLNHLFPRDTRSFWSSSRDFGDPDDVRRVYGGSGNTSSYSSLRDNYFHGVRCVR